MKKIVSIIFVFLFLLNFISALDTSISEVDIKVVPHYFLNGNEIKLFYKNQSYDGIGFEIVGKNHNYISRILGISIIDASPEFFKQSLPNTTIDLRILQEKTLFTSKIIPINEFVGKNISLWINLTGLHEKSNKKISFSNQTVFKIEEIKVEETFFYQVGNSIWEGNYTGGLFIGSIIILIILILIWKYQVMNWISEANEKSIKRRKTKYLNEEGY